MGKILACVILTSCDVSSKVSVSFNLILKTTRELAPFVSRKKVSHRGSEEVDERVSTIREGVSCTK
jgi:hypothetical protein